MAMESRFAFLLQPIRDLTKNWDVDVASQLEEYLTEVGDNYSLLEAMTFHLWRCIVRQALLC